MGMEVLKAMNRSFVLESFDSLGIGREKYGRKLKTKLQTSNWFLIFGQLWRIPQYGGSLFQMLISFMRE